MTENIVQLQGISKSWGPVTALNTVNLDVRRGEIVTLLGPSGCGKSTLMRITAGFETPTSGKVLIEDKDVTGIPPEKRPVNMVFQRYALFPHLDVFDNVAFGLRLRKVPKSDVRAKVMEMLKLVHLEHLSSRWINQLSGGESQRVALARALVNRPAVLLLDEPLAALDLKIRHIMLEELKRIHIETGTTFIYVTHDQDEAMILSDRVVLMNKGAIEQIGTPDEMYGAPRTLFCAKFFGETNILDGKVQSTDRSGSKLETSLGPLDVAVGNMKQGANIHVSLRPESITLSALADRRGTAGPEVEGTVEDVVFIGSRVVYKVRHANGALLKCQEPRTSLGIRFGVDSKVNVKCDPKAIVVLGD